MSFRGVGEPAEPPGAVSAVQALALEGGALVVGFTDHAGGVRYLAMHPPAPQGTAGNAQGNGSQPPWSGSPRAPVAENFRGPVPGIRACPQALQGPLQIPRPFRSVVGIGTSVGIVLTSTSAMPATERG